ncbi:hypothetical protein K523DRAFT_368576 [Schizophyllum commune Tattone D]|nr:hypothetical protein K523DRAFT_368576 [Schizophyllum commune Tattone D]
MKSPGVLVVCPSWHSMKRISVSVHNSRPSSLQARLPSNLELCPVRSQTTTSLSQIPNRTALHRALIAHSTLPTPYSTASRPSTNPRPGRPRRTVFHTRHFQTTLHHSSSLRTRFLSKGCQTAHPLSAPARAPSPSPTPSPSAPGPGGSIAERRDPRRRRR